MVLREGINESTGPEMNARRRRPFAGTGCEKHCFLTKAGEAATEWGRKTRLSLVGPWLLGRRCDRRPEPQAVGSLYGPKTHSDPEPRWAGPMFPPVVWKHRAADVASAPLPLLTRPPPETSSFKSCWNIWHPMILKQRSGGGLVPAGRRRADAEYRTGLADRWRRCSRSLMPGQGNCAPRRVRC